jgi:hypothetical protein
MSSYSGSLWYSNLPASVQPSEHRHGLLGSAQRHSACQFLRLATFSTPLHAGRYYMVKESLALSPDTWLLFSRLIPIASTITPTALSIEAMEPQPIHDYYAPTIKFDTLSYVAGLGTSGLAMWNPQQFAYEGLSQVLKRITTAVAALGAVLPINPPPSNSSWDTEFRGPAVRCDPLSASESNAVKQNIQQYIDLGVCWAASGYATWFGDLSYTVSS